MKYQRHPKPIILQKSSLRELDELVFHLSTRRDTFTEEEVLRSIWDKGEEVRLREDDRFWHLECGHWQLAEHRLANDLLVERLQDGRWDGVDLNEVLASLDNEFGVFHVFCPIDARLKAVDDKWQLVEIETLPDLQDEIRSLLNRFADDLLREWLRTTHSPWPTQVILNKLQGLGWQSPENSHLIITAWLLSRSEEWARVAKDLWIPRQALPDLSVMLYRVANISSDLELPALLHPDQAELSEDSEEAIGTFTPQPVTASEHHAITWKLALRTVHLNNAYIPVPPEVLSRTISWTGMSDIHFVRGLWHEDASHFDLWLDQKKGRLFGEGLAERIGLLDAGSVLKVKWDGVGVMLSIEGIDEDVNQEESRLIDPDSLAALRRGFGESYRQSLRAILAGEHRGLSIPHLHRKLSERQGHIIHRGSLRAILYLCPEFFRDGRLWRLKTDVDGAPDLRKSLVLLEAAGYQQAGLAGLHQVAREKIDRIAKRLEGGVR